MAAITQANASYVIDETTGTLAFDEFVQAEPVMPALYTQRGSVKDREVRRSVSGLGDFQEKTELAEPAEDRPIQQFGKEYLHREFALQVKVERKVVDDQRFEFVQEFSRHLGMAAMRKIEKDAARQFNEAFTSADLLGEDGLSLCNAAHLNVDGGNSQANRGTTALSFTSAGTTRAAMREWTDYRGNLISVVPDLLLTPAELEQTAWEIIRSSGDPTSANLKANFHNGRYGLIPWSRLTDATNWFMIDSRMMRKNLFWYWRIVLETFGNGDLFAGLRQIGGYYRSSHGFADWRFVYGHEVAG